MAVRQFINKTLFNRLLPRSSQYIDEPSVNQMYTSVVTPERKIQILHTGLNNNQEISHVVILAHPYLAQAKLFFHHAGHVQYYKEAGLSVVMFDFNGFGESPFSDFHFEKDIAEVVQWVETCLKPKYIVLHGISFGAAQIIKYGATGKAEGILSIIENCLDKGIHYFLQRNVAIYVFLKCLYSILPDVRRKDDLTRGISLCWGFRGMGFIYGQDDLLTTPAMGEKLMTHCPVSRKNIVLKGKHLEGIRQVPHYQNFLGDLLNHYFATGHKMI